MPLPLIGIALGAAARAAAPHVSKAVVKATSKATKKILKKKGDTRKAISNFAKDNFKKGAGYIKEDIVVKGALDTGKYAGKAFKNVGVGVGKVAMDKVIKPTIKNPVTALGVTYGGAKATDYVSEKLSKKEEPETQELQTEAPKPPKASEIKKQEKELLNDSTNLETDTSQEVKIDNEQDAYRSAFNLLGQTDGFDETQILNTDNSVVDILKEAGFNSDFDTRKQLYESIYDDEYKGSRQQNLKSIQQFKGLIEGIRALPEFNEQDADSVTNQNIVNAIEDYGIET